MSEEVAAAAADLETVVQLRRQLEIAMRENEQHILLERVLTQSHHDAWVLIGRLDYFLEMMESQPATARRQLARKLRGEIKDARKPKRPPESTPPATPDWFWL